MQKTNRIHELYCITVKLRQRSSKNKNIRETLKDYFKIEEEYKILELVSKLIKNATLAVEEVKNTKIRKKEIYLKHLNKVLNAYRVMVNLDKPYSEFLSKLSEGDMDSFELASEKFLDELPCVNKVIEKDLTTIKTCINSIHEILREKNLPEELEIYIFDSISKIEYAVKYFEVNGVEGLKETLSQIIGYTFLLTKEGLI